MAFVVLFSTMSFSVDMHYCGDTLVDTAVFQKAKSCGMEMQQSDATSECSIMKKNCCSDEEVVFEGQDELKISLDKLTKDQQIIAAFFVYSYNNLFEDLEERKTHFLEYPPPLIVRQIYKLDESYLI